ncbi:DMT family transporter [Mesorhizobium ciceri]|uniref:DMT family transporter n=1 Tax=Mesorhizobium TaxID=68287 RepID=UPI0004B3192F|nr:DMT family transporter [Mesorhizobium ciceri]
MSRFKANSLLMLAAVIWGVGNVFHKTILAHLDPMAVVFLTSVIAGLVTLPFAMRERDPITNTGWFPSVTRVVLLFALGCVVQQLSYVSTTVTNSSLLISASTVITPIAAWLIMRERPSALILFVAILTVVGSALLAGGFNGSATAGDAFAIMTAICFAVWTVELGRHVQAHGHPFATAAAQFIGTAVATLPFALQGTMTIQAIIAAWPELIMLGVFSTAVGFCLQTSAQRYTTSSHAAVICSGEGVFAAISAAALLGERLSPDGFLGAGVILSCVLFAAVSAGPKLDPAVP